MIDPENSDLVAALTEVRNHGKKVLVELFMQKLAHIRSRLNNRTISHNDHCVFVYHAPDDIQSLLDMITMLCEPIDKKQG